jgi:hypothetical protein
MKHPSILSPILCTDNLYHLCRETSTGQSAPYAEPTFPNIGHATEYCRQINIKSGRTRDEVVMGRLKAKEIIDIDN